MVKDAAVQDANGQELAVGDRVTLEAEVVEIMPHDTFCNVVFRPFTTHEYRPRVLCHSAALKKLPAATKDGGPAG